MNKSDALNSGSEGSKTQTVGVCFQRQALNNFHHSFFGLDETANAHSLVQVLNLPDLEVAVMYSGVHHGLEVLCEKLGIFVLQGDGGRHGVVTD
jgi:hypothetical protein